MTLSDLLTRYGQHNLNISKRSLVAYWCVVREFAKWLRRPPTLDDLSEDAILDFMRHSMGCRSARTTNNRRQVLLTLLRFARRRKLTELPMPEIPKIQEPRRVPQAWRVEELTQILHACGAARTLRGWDQRHWRALVLTCFDSGSRIGTLLRTERSQLTPDGWLTLRAEHVKNKEDVLCRLRRETMAAIAELPEHTLLFPWPLHPRSIWHEYGLILKAAGLPSGARWKFHCIRRSSASYVCRELGEAAASNHLGHLTPGLARRSYIDPRIAQPGSASDVLPEIG